MSVQVQRRSKSLSPVLRGFTLVELLVVIGIIAILISLLLPTLNKVRMQGYSVKCLSNLSQLGSVVANYLADHQQKLPYGYLKVLPLVAGQAQIADNPLPGLMSENRFPRGQSGPVYRAFLGAGATRINTPGFLICPQEALVDSGLRTIGVNPPFYCSFTYGEFRGSANKYPILSSGGADEGGAIYSYVGADPVNYTTDNNLLFSHYTFNFQMIRDQELSAGNSPPGSHVLTINGGTYHYQNMFASLNGTGTYSTDFNNLQPVTKVRDTSSTWLANDGSGGTLVGLSIYGAVFRHPHLSCNFLYYDGHAENIPSSQIDSTTVTEGFSPVTRVINDLRMLPIRN